MLKIIRLLLFSLILDAYCEKVLADPYEPAETWFTTRSSSTNQTKGSLAPSKSTPFNKEREYAKILNLIRDVKKSLVKNNEKENTKSRQEEKVRVNKQEKSNLKSVPLFPTHKIQNVPVIVKMPPHRKQQTTEIQQTLRQAEHQKLVNHIRHLLTKEREKIRLGKHDPRTGPFHYGQVPKPIIKTEPTAAATKDDDIANDKRKIEKQILKNKTPSTREDSLADLSALVDKLRVLANISTIPKDAPKHSEMQQKTTTKDKPRDIMEDQAFWAGLVIGCGVAAFCFAMCYFVAVLYRTFRRKHDGSRKALDLNFNCPPESYKERYSTFSRMHDPKTGKKYIVLTDETNNYSISSSDTSSEEEIYNASSHSPVTKPVHSPVTKPSLNVSNRSSMNRTSTPIKTPLRLTRSAPGSPSVRRNLSHSWTSPPISPLASVTPVFASPVKLPG
ncbi:uncharacterized protein LOC133179009 [Saccostrea echinata]|uniref:uncharacterized protein LOC133179009 n=1 Tax=Saccostrea echinata TaxID=191078 RepID=UPI002A83D0B2|nr:uncharacterized protein LOC133179009 [Saccostrea echinata]